MSDTQPPAPLELAQKKGQPVPASPNAQTITAKPTTPTAAQVQEQARKVAKKQIAEGFALLAVHQYTSADGQPLYWKIRAKHPDTGEKFIRAFHWTGSAFKASEPDHPDTGKPLYGLHGIAQADPAAVVWITEGEQKADALNALGLVATTTGGSSSANKSDWQPLAGRPVVVWPDHDEPGQRYAADVARILHGLACTVSVVRVADIEGMPIKGDVVDWLEQRTAAGLTTSAADVEGLPLDLWQPDPEPQGEPEPIDEQAELIRLAALSPLEYDRQRGDAAKALGIRPVTLDKAVKGLQAEQAEADSTGGFFEPVEPWPDPVDGAALLAELVAVVHRHIACKDSTAQAAALWIVFTWCIDAAQVAPIACITAPEKRCGKTQLLNLIGELCRDPMPASNITAAALFRSIELWKPTLLIDEADAFMKDNEELRGVINAGHSRKSAYVVRTVGDDHTPARFNVWGAKAISGIGHLPDTVRDRSILLELRRKEPHEHRQRLRHADPAQWQRIKQQLCRWSTDHMGSLSQARPELPEALNDREQDNWEPLLAIADCAGGDWPELARRAALSISGAEQHSPSINEELLSDIRDIFERTRQARISSAQLVDYLTEDEECPWATWNRGKPITPRQLATRLGDFGIVSGTVRLTGGSTSKGYKREQFDDAFKRYLPKTRFQSVTTSQPLQDKACSDFKSVTQGAPVTDGKTLKPLQGVTCDVVTDKNPLSDQHAQNGASVTANDTQKTEPPSPIKTANGYTLNPGFAPASTPPTEEQFNLWEGDA